MSHIIKILYLITIIFTFDTQAQSQSQSCIKVYCVSYAGPMSCALENGGGYNYLSINGNSLYTKDLDQGTNKSRYEACFPNRYFRVGSNRINYFYASSDISAYYHMEDKLYLHSGNSSTYLFTAILKSQGNGGYSGGTDFTRSLKQINPNLHQRLEDLNNEKNEFLHKLKASLSLHGDLTAQINDLKQKISLVENGNIEDLNPEDFAAYTEQKALLEKLQGRYSGLEDYIHNQLLQDSLATIQDNAAYIASNLENTLSTQVGIDVSDLGYQDPRLALFPDLPPMPPKDKDDLADKHDQANNLYKNFADRTLAALEAKLKKNDRLGFIKEATKWAKHTEKITEMMLSRQLVSQIEINDFIDQNNRVNQYLYGPDGKLERDNWFRDSPVPKELRNMLAELLSQNPNDPTLNNLNNLFLKQEPFLSRTEDGFKLFTAATYIIHGLVAIQKEYNSLLAQGIVTTKQDVAEKLYIDQITQYKMLQDIVHSGVQAGIRDTWGGSWLRICEIATGKYLCDFNQRSLTEEEVSDKILDVATGLGVGAFLVKIGPSFVVKVDGKQQAIFQGLAGKAAKAKEVLKSATKFGATTKAGFEKFMEIAKQPFFRDPQAGSINISLLNEAIDKGKDVLKGWRKNHKITGIEDASVINQKFIDQGWEAPYKTGTKVFTFTTKSEGKWVRVHGSASRPEGGWLMKEEAISGLSPSQIQNKYSLPAIPTHITDVQVPANTSMNRGKVAENFAGGEGAIQYHLQQKLDSQYYTNTRPL